MAQTVKRLSTMQETWVQFLVWEDPLEKEMAAHSSILAWKIPWTVAYQALLSDGLPRQEYWSGLLLLSPGDLPKPGIEPRSQALQADSIPTEVGGNPFPGLPW